jgi:hypothetical protein
MLLIGYTSASVRTGGSVRRALSILPHPHIFPWLTPLRLGWNGI